MALKRYSKKEPLVFLWVMIPYITLLNLLVFGSCIASSFAVFLKGFLYTGIFMGFVYFLFGLIAAAIQRKFSSAGEMFKRIAIMLPVFYLMNCVVSSALFYLYDEFPLLSCPVKQGMLPWTIFYTCLMSTIITFINEGVAHWELWKASLSETNRLKTAYQQSRVLGLKGQINPHFLFNCFNTLSGLIQEDENKAEKFLDEMTKVHRYLLRTDDELLVPLEMEIRFSESYLYLAKERFGGAVQYNIIADNELLQKRVPPLSMQVILENIIYTNALNKTDPLTINIGAENENTLSIINSIHPKTVVQNYQVDDGLDNLLDKYKMLSAEAISIRELDHQRILSLPLFEAKEVNL